MADCLLACATVIRAAAALFRRSCCGGAGATPRVWYRSTLTPIRGHRTVQTVGLQHAQAQAAVPGGISQAPSLPLACRPDALYQIATLPMSYSGDTWNVRFILPKLYQAERALVPESVRETRRLVPRRLPTNGLGEVLDSLDGHRATFSIQGTAKTTRAERSFPRQDVRYSAGIHAMLRLSLP